MFIDNQTGCYYILSFVDCDVNDCTAGPMDAPPNDRVSHSFATAGISSITDIFKLCIVEHPSGTPEPPIDINCSNPTSPVYVCQVLTCDNQPLLVNWWVSGSDFNIELSI